MGPSRAWGRSDLMPPQGVSGHRTLFSKCLRPRSCSWLVFLEPWRLAWLMGEEGQALGTSPGSESQNLRQEGAWWLSNWTSLYSPGAKAQTLGGYVTFPRLPCSPGSGEVQ